MPVPDPAKSKCQRFIAPIPAKVAKVLAGRSRIVEMDTWDNNFLVLAGGGAPRTARSPSGALKGFLDVRYGAPDQSASAAFSWEGNNNAGCGRGWAAIGTAGRIVGHFYIPNPDKAGFVCERD